MTLHPLQAQVLASLDLCGADWERLGWIAFCVRGADTAHTRQVVRHVLERLGAEGLVEARSRGAEWRRLP